MNPRFSPFRLRQHWNALVLPLVCDVALLGLALGFAVQFAAPLVFAAVALSTALHAAAQIQAWAIFEISFTAHWIAVREARWGLPHTTMYPYSAIRAVAHFQRPLGWITNSGTLTLTLVTRTRQFGALTPYQLLVATLA